MRTPKEGAWPSRQGATGVSCVPVVEAVAVRSRAAAAPAATVAKAATLVSAMGPREGGRRRAPGSTTGVPRPTPVGRGTRNGKGGFGVSCAGWAVWQEAECRPAAGLMYGKKDPSDGFLAQSLSLGVGRASGSRRNCPGPVGKLHPGVPLSAACKDRLGIPAAGGCRVCSEYPLESYCWRTRCPPRRYVSVGSAPKSAFPPGADQHGVFSTSVAST